MPRRNRTPRRPAPAPGAVQAEELTYQQLARDLVKRGLAPKTILGPRPIWGKRPEHSRETV